MLVGKIFEFLMRVDVRLIEVIFVIVQVDYPVPECLSCLFPEFQYLGSAVDGIQRQNVQEIYVVMCEPHCVAVKQPVGELECAVCR